MNVVSTLAILLIRLLQFAELNSFKSNGENFFDLNCGVKYGCWIGKNFIVTWEPHSLEKYVRIGQFVEAATDMGKVFFGLSIEEQNPLDVTECVIKGNNLTVRHYFQTSNGNYFPTTSVNLVNQTGATFHGAFGCEYDRSIIPAFDSLKTCYLPLNDSYFFYIYQSEPGNNGLTKLSHSSLEISLLSINVFSLGTGLPAYISTHSLMMVVAWGFLIPFGVALLKILRFTSVFEKQYKGFNIVVVLHASVNLSGLILTLISGVYMMIQQGGFDRGIHAIMGFVVLCLCVVQCLLGALHFAMHRFVKLYWMHRCLGGVLTYSALLNVFLGIKRVVDSGASKGLYVFYLCIVGIVGMAYIFFEVYSCSNARLMGNTPVCLLMVYVLVLILLLILFGVEVLSTFVEI